MNLSRVTEPDIATARLDLVHLSVADIVAMLNDPQGFDTCAGRSFANPMRVLMDDTGPLAWRVPQAVADPSTNKWFVRLMVLRDEHVVVGSTSFHGPPDENGMIEIGLGVDENFRRRGFATEALLGMWSWVTGEPNVGTLRYTVGISNEPSIQLVNRFGFTKVGQQIDEIDGPEDIYEMPATEFRSLYC